MKDLIEFIAKSLVEHPDQVEVREYGNGDHIRIELSVARDDMGRVIGKSGKVANSIRILLKWPLSGKASKQLSTWSSRSSGLKKNSSKIGSGSPKRASLTI